jgi:spore coat protein CotH
MEQPRRKVIHDTILPLQYSKRVTYMIVSLFLASVFVTAAGQNVVAQESQADSQFSANHTSVDVSVTNLLYL